MVEIVSVRSLKGETTDVYLKKDGDRVDGLVVLDAEPKELTFVHIDAPIDPEELSELSGHLGIPPFGRTKPSQGHKQEGKKSMAKPTEEAKAAKSKGNE